MRKESSSTTNIRLPPLTAIATILLAAHPLSPPNMRIYYGERHPHCHALSCSRPTTRRRGLVPSQALADDSQDQYGQTNASPPLTQFCEDNIQCQWLRLIVAVMFLSGNLLSSACPTLVGKFFVATVESHLDLVRVHISPRPDVENSHLE